jgi:hypothetical protein
VTHIDRDSTAAIELLTQKVDALQSACSRLTHENQELWTALRSRSGPSSGINPDTAQEDLVGSVRKTTGPACSANGNTNSLEEAELSEEDRFRTEMSRRGMFATAIGMAAAVAGASVVIEGFIDPAGASDGNAVVAGGSNTAEQPTTVLYNGSSGFGGVVFLANDSTYSASDPSYPAALGGWAGAGASAGDGGVANGIYGFTDNGGGYAVVGVNGNAVSGSGAGVLGTNGGGTGVEGRSDSVASNATAILGIITSTSPGGFSSAVRGQNNGTGGFGIGVYGSQAGSGWGMYATSVSGIALNADGGTGVGVNADGGVGIEAFGTTGVGVLASGSTYGLTASGSLAPLHLSPAGAAGPPATGAHSSGELYVDANGRLYYCMASGTPGTWVKMAPLVPVNPPKRAYDSRTHDGPLAGGGKRNVSLSSGGLPAGASLALINLTVVKTVGAGYLSLYEEGTSAPSPLTSNINWFSSGQTIANNATVAVSSSGGITVQAGGTTDFVIDVFGFYF